MVRNNSEAFVFLGISSVTYTCFFFKSVNKTCKQIYLKNIRTIHYGRRYPFQTSSKIYIFLRQLSKFSGFFFLILHKDGVSDFKKLTATAIGMAEFSKTWIVFNLIKFEKDFTIRSPNFARRHFVGRPST